MLGTVSALLVLAEVYRAARSMWPRREEAAGQTVTVHIGESSSS